MTEVQEKAWGMYLEDNKTYGTTYQSWWELPEPTQNHYINKVLVQEFSTIGDNPPPTKKKEQ